MRDAVPPCGTAGGAERGRGAGTAPDDRPNAPTAPSAPTAPVDPTAPSTPSAPPHPGATRAGRHGRPPRPNVLNDPARHTRETHSGALAAALRTRRTRPSRPPPRPSCSTSSKPPLNNLRGSGVVAAAGMGGRGVVRVGLPGRSGAGRVRICCKGAPRPDRPRMKARNINDSPPALRCDRGLCNRFGQPTLRWIERAPRTPAPMGRMGLVGRPGALRRGEEPGAATPGPRRPHPAPDDRTRPPSAAGCGRARAWPRRAPTAR